MAPEDDTDDIDVLDPRDAADAAARDAANPAATAAPEPEADEPEADDAAEGEEPEEASAEDDDEGDDDNPAGIPRVGKKKGALGRIAELVQKRKEAEKLAFEAELRALEAERRAAAAVPASPAKVPVKPDPDKYHYGTVDEKYLEDLVEYRAAMREAERTSAYEAEIRQRTEAERNAHYRKRLGDVMAEGKKAHADFEEVLMGTHFPEDLARMVLDSEKAVDVAYYLSQNARDLLELVRMGPVEQARVIGKLEGKFSATASAVKKSNAPQPTVPKAKQARKDDKEAAIYGPEDQDEFDKVFFQ